MKKTLLFLFIALLSIGTINAQLTESFDAGIPAGWANVHTIGGNGSAIWTPETTNALGGDLDDMTTFNVDPHSGAGMASFKSYDFLAGNGANLITGAVNLSSGAPHVISFWLHRDNGFSNIGDPVKEDSVSVFINTAQTGAGASFLGKVIRNKSSAPLESGVDGWYQYSFNVPAGFNTAANYFIFSAVGASGNNIFIDDVVVSSAPSCAVPTLNNITGYNYAANTASISWTAPSTGTPTGYQWAINTTNIDPVSGTSVAGTSVAVTGITQDVLNYLYIRTDCGGGNFSAWVKKTIAAMPCATVISPLAGSTSIPQGTLFNWNAVSGADGYTFFFGTTPGSEANIQTSPSTSTGPLNLLPNTNYSWYVIPSIGGVVTSSVCSSNTFTTGAEPNTPANNSCSGAVSIPTVNNSPVSGTTLNATMSLAADACSQTSGGLAGTADDDVWYEFTTPAVPAGNITLTPTSTGGITDVVALVYQGATCNTIGGLTTCADATNGGASEVVNLSTLAPNTHYYLRVFSYTGDAASKGKFSLLFFNGSTLPVTLVSFTASRSNGVNILNWKTSQELNSSRFVIERSSNGSSFTSMGEVVAAGNSNTERSYVFTDNQPLKGNNFYRLRTVDRDNSFKLSDIRRVRNDGIADVSIYPNPVQDRLTVSINADKASDGQLIITDMSGKAVYSRSVKVFGGQNNIPLELGRVSTGAYILKIQLNDDVIVQKFNKL